MLNTVLAALLVAAAAFAMPAAAQGGTSPTLERIKAAKAVNIAYSPDSPPFSSTAALGVPAGYSIALCQRVVTQIARAVGEPNLKINWIAGSGGQRLRPGQAAGAGRRHRRCVHAGGAAHAAAVRRIAGIDGHPTWN